MNNMLGKVARALHDEWNGVGNWAALTDREARRWEHMALTAINTLSSPSIEMITAGGQAVERGSAPEEVLEAMLYVASSKGAGTAEKNP